MRASILGCGVTILLFPLASIRSQQPGTLPASRAEVGAWDGAIVKRAEQILASPDRWNRADTTACSSGMKTFSLLCALQKAVDDAAGVGAARASAVAGQPAPPVNCRFRQVQGKQEGSCGVLFDEIPLFDIAPAKAITSGVWRTDAQPTAVWTGTMADAGSPVAFEARQLVNVITTKRYPARLSGFNDDTATTFAALQSFLHALEVRVLANGAADLDRTSDDVEIELYTGGTGVIRTYNGWYPVSAFVARDSTLSFQIDTLKQIPPNSVDREILQKAEAILTNEAVWNRADDRKCPTTATTWSIYCAVERAEIEVTGGFHHRRPAMELVREIIDERTKTKSYQHRAMGYNNDPSTHLSDVASLFAEAIARIK